MTKKRCAVAGPNGWNMRQASSPPSTFAETASINGRRADPSPGAAKPRHIRLHIFLHPLSSILHHKPRVRQRHDLLKKPMSLIDAAKVFVILSLPQTKTRLPRRHRCELLANTRQYKRLDVAEQFPVVVIVQVLPVSYEPQRGHSRKKIIPVKGI